MSRSISDDEIRRSRKNRDESRSEEQRCVRLTKLVKILGDRCGKLSICSGQLQAKSAALIQRSKKIAVATRSPRPPA